MAGRTPKPTALKAGKRAVNRDEPKPLLLEKRKAMALGRDFLIGGEAKRLWPYLYEPLREARLATEADIFPLLELAESIGEMREARLAVQALEAQIAGLSGGTDLGNGAALVDEDLDAQIGKLERRMAARKLDIKWAYDRVRDLMSGMGCTPAARSKIKLEDAQSDMFADAMRMLDVTFHNAGEVSEESPGAV